MSKKEGVLLINKPAGPTSHDIVKEMRKITGIKKIGHAGTLDPFAEGLLILLIGRSFTRQQASFLKKDKEYLATFYLGKETDTFDKTGKITKKTSSPLPQDDQIEKVIKKFKGKTLQIPPQFSAKKIRGKKAYEIARQGKKIKLDPVEIDIKEIKILKYTPPFLQLKILCSAGTYIRGIARDLGRSLKCGVYVEKLTRTKSGKFNLKQAIELNNLNEKNWQNKLLTIDKH